MTTPSDQDIASACRYLEALTASADAAERTIGRAYPARYHEAARLVVEVASELGWKPTPSAPLYTEEEVLRAMEAVRRDIATRALPLAKAMSGAPKPHPLGALFRVAGVDLWNECVAGDNDGHHPVGADKPLNLKSILARVRGER
jgi:hypothetical protein